MEIVYILKQVGYVLFYKGNFRTLGAMVAELNLSRNRVIHMVDEARNEARNEAEVIEGEVLVWLHTVDLVLGEAYELYNNYYSAVCSPWSFPNLTSRRRLSRGAKKLTYILPYLLVKGRFDHVTYRRELESRESVKKAIAEALIDPNVTKIGIYGLSGVERTVLAEQVAQQVKGDMFDAVSMITVSQTPDFERIQCEIADLHERIKKVESILIILDDVRETTVLERLGIPLADDTYKGCKFLLTSRNQDILQKNDTQENFSLQLLNQEESWSLFQSRAGDALKEANLQAIAKKLVQICGGWPFAIVTLAASLQGRGFSYWKEALRILDENAYMGMNKTIYSIVEFSYNQLEDDEVKQVFLLCGLHGPSISVSDLLKYVIGLGVFKQVIPIADARNKLHRIIVDLEEKSLLLRCSAREVNVHDIICEVVSSIASRDDHVFKKESTAPLEYWPRDGFLRGCSQIILKGNYIQKLPETLDCPNLCFLYLNTNDNPILEIPHSFFEGTANLQVFVLIGMTIPSLPASLVSLTKLKTLCFNQCCLQDMVGIGALKCLQILSFFQSSVKEFPSEIGQLTNLRMLNLSSSEISWLLRWSIMFEKLETYNIVIGDKWGWSDSNGTSRSLKLKPDPNIHLGQEIKAIVKGVEDLYLEEIIGFSNVLYELNGEGFPLLKKLHIQNNTKIQHIVYSSERNQTPAMFPNLKTMILDNLDNLKEICHGPLAADLFQKLEVVKVKSCGKLEYLFLESMIKKFSQLVEIEVSECNSMKNIVLLDTGTTIYEIESTTVRFLTLQHLGAITGFCSNSNAGSLDIPTLFPNAKDTLPGLMHLKLIHISTIVRLVSWIPINRAVPLENLETMKIVECKDLNYLFDIEDRYNDEVIFGGLLPKLRQLCLRNLHNFESIVRPNNIHKKMLKFKMLNNLTVCGCDKLKYLLPLYVLKDLEHLKSFDISDCANLERVFVDEQTKQTTEPDVMEALPLLHSLKLANLPKLASMCSGAGHVVSRSLTQLTIQKCPEFRFTFTLGRIEEQGSSKKESKEMIVIPSKLKKLNLQEVDDLKNMCEYPLFSLAYLTSLQLSNCNKLEHLFSFSMAQELSSLKVLKIISCRTIEQIVKIETEEREGVVKFPQVKTLNLDDLPKFTGMSNQDGSRVKWLALGTVQVTNCPNIKKTMLGTVDRPLLKNVIVANCPPRGYEDIESKIGYLFNLTDELSKLLYLRIEDSKQLKNYMEMNLQESSFTQLQTVEALQCDNELNKFLSILLRRSHMLDRLTIENCELLEQVFDLTEFVDEEQEGNLKFPHLKTMKLLCLPKLKCIWNKDPRRIVELGKLVKLEIIKCGLCMSPLSTSLLEKLVLLEELKIESCEMIEHVVVQDHTQMHERSFPNLKDLQLANLPKLIKFNSGRCDFRFPSLKILKIEKCPELVAFTTGFLSSQTLTNEGTSDHACPNLQKLTLADLKVVEVDSLRRLENLETLVVRNCSSLGRLVLPSKCFNLKEIEVSGCNILEKIFTDPEPEKTGEKTFGHLESIVLENLKMLSFFLEKCEFPSLKNLRLVNCPALVTLPRNVSAKTYNSLNKHSASHVLFDDIKEDSLAVEGQMKISPQLESLELADLPNMPLWKQEPQIPVFQKLILLKIMRCRGIEKLFSISVAEHLSVLKFLNLYECTNMVQVLGGGGGNRKQVFRNLETLVLKHLPSLTSFCEDDVDFEEFPELNMVRVEDVPNMNTFVKKPLRTPKLKQVRVTFITKYWLGDLNETIKYLHENRDEVWECDQSSTRHHSDIAESSSRMYQTTQLGEKNFESDS